MRKNKMSATSTFDGLMVTSKSSTAHTAPASSPAHSSQGQIGRSGQGECRESSLNALESLTSLSHLTPHLATVSVSYPLRLHQHLRPPGSH